jgi:Bacterial SH3 domain
MANCYRCGAPNANYRRNTFTGESKTSWTSKSSYGSGSRTYYGMRSVCEDCANEIDHQGRMRVIRFVITVAIILGIAAIIFSENSSSENRGNKKIPSTYKYTGETARVTAANGVNLRDLPNSIGTILLTIPKDDIVGILDKDFDSETISGQTADWYKVDYRGTTGWVWSGYLEER